MYSNRCSARNGHSFVLNTHCDAVLYLVFQNMRRRGSVPIMQKCQAQPRVKVRRSECSADVTCLFCTAAQDARDPGEQSMSLTRCMPFSVLILLAIVHVHCNLRLQRFVLVYQCTGVLVYQCTAPCLLARRACCSRPQHEAACIVRMVYFWLYLCYWRPTTPASIFQQQFEH